MEKVSKSLQADKLSGLQAISGETLPRELSHSGKAQKKSPCGLQGQRGDNSC